MLKFACFTNSLKLCPLVVEKLLFDRKLVTLLSYLNNVVKNHLLLS